VPSGGSLPGLSPESHLKRNITPYTGLEAHH
jgi:hypothetical protein